MSTKITKGSLVGLLAGVGLGMIFPPLGTALVIAGAVGGAAVGRAMEEEEKEETEEPEVEPGVDRAEKLLEEFDRWDRRLTSGENPEAQENEEEAEDSEPAFSPERTSTAKAPGRGVSRDGARDGHRDGSRTGIRASLYQQVAEAEELLKSGRFLEAIDRFRALKDQLLEATSGAGASDRQRVVDGLRMALHRLAGVLIEADSPAEAEELLRESLELAPGDRDTLLHLARLQLMLNQPEAAEPYLQEAIEAHPQDPEAYRLLGDMYVETGRLEDARLLFRQALDEAQDSALTIEMLDRIAGLDPDDPGPLVELAKAHASEGDWEQAARAYRGALARSPGDAYLRRKLGAALLRLGHSSEAVSLLESVPGLQDDLEVLVGLAHYDALAGEDGKALPLLRRFRELDLTFSGMDPLERRQELRQHGLSGDQVEALYAPLRMRALLDFAAVETRAGTVEAAAAAGREALAYGGTTVGGDAVAVTTALAAEYERQGNLPEAQRWREETARLGGSLDRVRQERDTYEDFLRRFRWDASGLIAEGGMARVYRGTDNRTGRAVAIKRMHDRFCTDPQAVAYFYREVRAQEELSRPYPHENIVEFIASGITESRFTFAMEYVEGPSLRQVMERGELWSLDELCRLAIGICAGLDRAHNSVRHIIHRDLKPENVLMTADNVPKLTDFGIARVSSLFSTSRRYYGSTQSFVGTSLYSAPEQYPDPYSGQIPPADARADLYSLGCILYEMLTTQPPFLAADPGTIGLMHQRRPLPGKSEPEPLLPPSERNPLAMERFTPEQRARLDRLVLRCLELKPSRRFRSARELSAEIAGLTSEPVSGATPESSPAAAGEMAGRD